MRTLVNLRLWTIIAILFVGMSACSKDEDSVNVYVQNPYIIQNSDGTFTPQVRLFSYDLASATLNVAGQRYNFKTLENSYFIWELEDPMFLPKLDSIPEGYYALTATNKGGKSEIFSVGFPEAKKKMGDIELLQFEYAVDSNKIYVELADSVQNATDYYLMIKEPIPNTSSYAMWVPSVKLNLNKESNWRSEVSLEGASAGTYYFAVGANYGSVIKFSTATITVTIQETSTGTN